MAIRNIVKEGDPILNKVCRPVTRFDDRLATLLDDMHETMIQADGVGLAGPQVGMRRRLFAVGGPPRQPAQPRPCQGGHGAAVEGHALYQPQQLIGAEPPAQTGGQQHGAYSFHRQNWEGPRDT